MKACDENLTLGSSTSKHKKYLSQNKKIKISHYNYSIILISGFQFVFVLALHVSRRMQPLLCWYQSMTTDLPKLSQRAWKIVLMHAKTLCKEKGISRPWWTGLLLVEWNCSKEVSG